MRLAMNMHDVTWRDPSSARRHSLGKAELIGEDKRLAVFGERLPPILVQRMDRHGEEAELRFLAVRSTP
jgi:hypothetical protein